MSKLSVYGPQAELVRHLDTITSRSGVAVVSMNELSRMHEYAATQVSISLAVAQAELKAAAMTGRLTPAKEAAVHQLTQQYLDHVSGTLAIGGDLIVQTLYNAPVEIDEHKWLPEWHPRRLEW